MSFQICLIGITGTFLANISKLTFPNANKSDEICKRNLIQREVSVHKRTPKFFKAYASVHAIGIRKLFEISTVRDAE